MPSQPITDEVIDGSEKNEELAKKIVPKSECSSSINSDKFENYVAVHKFITQFGINTPDLVMENMGNDKDELANATGGGNPIPQFENEEAKTNNSPYE